MTKISRGSIILLCAIFGVAMLIAAVCGFAYSPYSTDPVEAAEVQGTGTNLSVQTQEDPVICYLYVYYDNTYIQNVTITGLTGVAENTSNSDYANFTWNGNITVTIKSNISHTNVILGKFAWCNSNFDSDLEDQRSDAYTRAQSAETRVLTRSGTSTTYTSSSTTKRARAFWSPSSYNNYVAGVLILSDVGNSITASVSNGGDGKATIDKTSDYYVLNSGTQHTFTYTSYDNYYISSVTINNAKAPILESAPAEFLPTTGCSYKCYRNGAQVIVIVTNITQATTIRGVCSSLWSVTSNKASIVIQEDETLMNRTNYFVTEALIVAEFSRNQNLCIIFDGVTARLKGDYSTGTISLPSGGEAKYTFNIYNNFVAISLTFPKGPHTVALDYYVGIANNINTSFDAGHSGNVEIFIDSAGVYNLVVTPNGDDYVNSLTFDNVMVDITYYKAEIYGVGAAKTVTYVVKDNTNVFLLQLDTLYDDINVTFNLSSLKPDYEVPPAIVGGGNVGVSGTVVSATNSNNSGNSNSSLDDPINSADIL